VLPKEKTPPKTSLADLSVLLYSGQKFGKCLGGDTLLIDPATAKPITIKDFVERGEGQVLTMHEAAVLEATTPSAFLANEPAQLFRLKTQTGRTIEATANHPFLTRGGWKPLSELAEGDRVAVVAEYEGLHGQTKIDGAWFKILAYLIADGFLGRSSPTFTKDELAVRNDFIEAVEAQGDECIEFPCKGAVSVRVRAEPGKDNRVKEFIKSVGLDGLKSADKFIPDEVFSANRWKQALFLNRLFTCDGCVESSGKLSYSSKSIRMVRQVQHLLLRFGIVSLMRDRHVDGQLYGAELTINSKANVLRFLDKIGFFGEKATKAEMVRAALYNVRESESQADRGGSILFDRIRSIEPTRIEPVYDLTIPGTHNFVANDFIVHNSTFCSEAEGALFLATEPGLNHLEVFQSPINTWEDMLTACGEIAAGQHSFKTIVIDTIDQAYRLCVEYMNKKHKVEHESDLGFGKGYALINNEFYRVLNKLAMLPYGLLLISHAQEKEIETRTGKVTRIMPTLPDKARKAVLGLVDVILFGDFETVAGPDGKPQVRRVLRTKPSPHFEAGDRTKKLPPTIELDYAKFVQAFEVAKRDGASPTPGGGTSPSP